jgi:CelD/BcsL family acetyltransferase involved in cellulose biosynthesis
MLSTGPLRDFFREMCAAFRRRGWLRLHGIRADGRLGAVICVFLARGRAYYYLGGFDRTLERHSPGAALLHYAIESAIAEGAASFDFLRKREDYKYRWGAADRVNCRLVILTARSKTSRAA